MLSPVRDNSLSRRLADAGQAAQFLNGGGVEVDRSGCGELLLPRPLLNCGFGKGLDPLMRLAPRQDACGRQRRSHQDDERHSFAGSHVPEGEGHVTPPR